MQIVIAIEMVVAEIEHGREQSNIDIDVKNRITTAISPKRGMQMHFMIQSVVMR